MSRTGAGLGGVLASVRLLGPSATCACSVADTNCNDGLNEDVTSVGRVGFRGQFLGSAACNDEGNAVGVAAELCRDQVSTGSVPGGTTGPFQ